MKISKTQRMADEINALNPSQLYDLARELVARHNQQADNLDMMIRAEFQEQAMAWVERDTRKSKMAQQIAQEIFG
jgi:hypothetical protein